MLKEIEQFYKRFNVETEEKTPIKSLMELLNAPPYLQTELQLDFYKTEEQLIEKVFELGE